MPKPTALILIPIALVVLLIFGQTSGVKTKLQQLTAPEYGTCNKCNTPWKYAEPHSTYLVGSEKGVALTDESGEDIVFITVSSGVFALCEKCWLELGTAKARAPYYEVHWHDVHENSPDGYTWEEFEESLRLEEEGKPVKPADAYRN